MNVLLASDDNYAPLLGVVLYSLLENNESDFDDINIYVLDGGISEVNKNIIQSLIKGFDVKTKISFIKYDNLEEILGIKIKATRPLAAYSRLFTASLLSSDIDKILYIDCDGLVVDSLKELWNMDLDDNYCAGVIDAGPKYINTFLGLPEDNNHYNSGFLLINLKLWREDNLEKSFLDYIISKNGEVFHNDQGIINVICRDRILTLHPKYNILSPFFEVGYEKVLQWYNLEEYYNKSLVEDALSNPIFIHLTQFVHGRPWFNNAKNHPLRELFYSYVEKTPFKDMVYIDDNRHLKGKIFSFTYTYLPYSVVCFMFRVYEFIITKTRKAGI